MRSFNSRTPGGVRQELAKELAKALNVSIHAPREGCDLIASQKRTIDMLVSIHAPREGCDIEAHRVLHSNSLFQFTHPGRGAT